MDNLDIRQAKANHQKQTAIRPQAAANPSSDAPASDIRQANAIMLADQLKSLPHAPTRCPVPPLVHPTDGNHTSEPSLLVSKCIQLLRNGHFEALEQKIQTSRLPVEQIAYDLLDQSLLNQSLDQFKWVLSQWEFSTDTIDEVVKNPSVDTFIKLYAAPFASPRGIEDLSFWLTYTTSTISEEQLFYCSQVVTDPLAHLNILHSALRNQCPEDIVVKLVHNARPYLEQADMDNEEFQTSWHNVASTFLVRKSELVTRSVLSLPNADIHAAFMKECARGNVELVRWMTQLPSFNPKKLGLAPLVIASQNKNNEVVDILFDLWDLNDVKKDIELNVRGNPREDTSSSYLHQKFWATQSKQQLEHVLAKQLDTPAASSTPKSKM